MVQRNPWHVQWCESLLVLAATLRSLKTNEHFLLDTLNFVGCCLRRINETLDMSVWGQVGTNVWHGAESDAHCDVHTQV